MLFVSYASQDRAAIDNFSTALQRAHGRCGWTRIWAAVRRGGARSSSRFVAVRSSSSRCRTTPLRPNPARPSCATPEALQRPILPVQVGPVEKVCGWTPLAATQILDYRKPTKRAGIQLIEAVQELQAQLGTAAVSAAQRAGGAVRLSDADGHSPCEAGAQPPPAAGAGVGR